MPSERGVYFELIRIFSRDRILGENLQEMAKASKGAELVIPPLGHDPNTITLEARNGFRDRKSRLTLGRY